MLSVIKTKRTLKLILTTPHLAFLVLAGVFGLLYLILVPPFLQPDEGAHFDRVYQISEGHLIGQKLPSGLYGGYIPKAITDFESVDFPIVNQPTVKRTSFKAIVKRVVRPSVTINNSKDKLPQEFVNTVQYNPLIYAPQTLGLYVARLFNFSVVDTFYLLRLSGLMAWLLICAYGIKKMQLFGWAAMVFLLTPLCLNIVSGISADSMTIALSVLFMGLVADCLITKTVNFRKAVGLLVAAILVSCVKLPYELLLLLILVIPPSYYRITKQQKIYFLSAIAGAIILITGSWSLIAHKQYMSPRTITTGIVLNEKSQEAYLLEHPLSFVHKLYETYLKNNVYSYDPVMGFVGVLTTLGYVMPFWAICLYFALIGGVFVILRSGARPIDYLKPPTRWVVLAIFLAIFVAINALIFINWSRPRIPIIEGIQSRYFIPMAPLLVFILLPLNTKPKLPKSFYCLFVIIVSLVQLAALASVYYQFYAPPMPYLG